MSKIKVDWFLPTGGDSPDVLPDRLQEYLDHGFTEFILSGHAHVEEAHLLGEGVVPVLHARGLVDPLPESGGAGVFSFR